MSLKLQIITILARVPGGLPLSALRAELEIVTGRVPGDTDLEQALSELRGKGQITEGVHPLTDDRTFCIPAPEKPKGKTKKG